MSAPDLLDAERPVDLGKLGAPPPRPQKCGRLPDWQLRLAEFMGSRFAMPFNWGTNDCCLFAADAVLAMTGIDHAASLRGTYTTALGAQRIVDDAGGMLALTEGMLGGAMSPLLAGVGDVVLVKNEGRELLAICNGVNTLSPGAAGLVGLETFNHGLAAWRI